MKNWRTAVILAVLLAGLGSLATWDEWKTEQDETVKETSNRLASIKAEDVIGVRLRSVPDAPTGGDKTPTNEDATTPVEVSAKLIDGLWQVTAPVSTSADQQTIQDVIKNVIEYKYEQEVAESKSQWEQFGLNSPRRAVTLELKDGKEYSLYVGINAPVGFSVYVASSQNEKVYAGSQYIGTSLVKSVFDFRNKKLFSIFTPDIQSLSISTPGSKSVTLDKKDGKWLITSPEAVEADSVIVNNLLDDLTGLKAAEFLDKVSPEDAKAFAGKNHLVSYAMKGPKGELSFIMVQGKTGLLASLDQGKTTVKIGDEFKAKLVKTLDDLRNKKIFSFQSAQVEQVEIDGKVFKKVLDDWYLAEDAGKFDAEGKFSGKEEDKPAVKSHVRTLLVDLEFSKAEKIHDSKDPLVKNLPAAPKHKIKLGFNATSGHPPLTIDFWQAGDSPEQILTRPEGSAVVYRAKKSIIASMSDAPTIPADPATFPPMGEAP